MLSLRLVISLVFIFLNIPKNLADDPPFLFPHGYFDSAKLKPFDAIYLNMMAQSNLEYGGITLEELGKLGDSRKIIPRPPNLPRNREEDDISLDSVSLPLETDDIAPGKNFTPTETHRPQRPLTGELEEFVAASGGSPQTPSSLKGPSPSSLVSSALTMTATEHVYPGAKPLGEKQAKIDISDVVKKPPSPFRLIRRLQRRVRRATEEENPFEDIATRAPPRDQMQLQIVRQILRKTRRKKNKHFLTRNDIYDPKRKDRERMTRVERQKLREELALKPDSVEKQEIAVADDTAILVKETIRARHIRRPQQAPTDEKFETDLRTTPKPHLPTLVPTIEKAPRLPNNPFAELDISKPTIIYLPVPPEMDELFVR
ncbi:unnamed protein product [Cylicocyclus nassatus]|uniref:Uncharacterized protein n=1 Tax=Cylicocyclus nassatus TaxID=53992 RepID=A0AA36GYW0_CYLNA|nr:unnamed protein product [Cylicocyclus nassatus]